MASLNSHYNINFQSDNGGFSYNIRKLHSTKQAVKSQARMQKELYAPRVMDASAAPSVPLQTRQ
jgi:hypothetical protein